MPNNPTVSAAFIVTVYQNDLRPDLVEYSKLVSVKMGKTMNAGRPETNDVFEPRRLCYRAARVSQLKREQLQKSVPFFPFREVRPRWIVRSGGKKIIRSESHQPD